MSRRDLVKAHQSTNVSTTGDRHDQLQWPTRYTAPVPSLHSQNRKHRKQKKTKKKLTNEPENVKLFLALNFLPFVLSKPSASSSALRGAAAKQRELATTCPCFSEADLEKMIAAHGAAHEPDCLCFEGVGGHIVYRDAKDNIVDAVSALEGPCYHKILTEMPVTAEEEAVCLNHIESEIPAACSSALPTLLRATNATTSSPTQPPFEFALDLTSCDCFDVATIANVGWTDSLVCTEDQRACT